MPLFKFRKKKRKIELDEESISALIKKELEPYIKREDIQKHLLDIEKDELKKKIWDGLSTRKKLKLLRYLAKRGDKHDKQISLKR